MAEADAICLEEIEDKSLLKNIYNEFEKEGVKTGEYHIDTHQSFDNHTFRKSFRSTSTRPLMIIGQDEFVYKQYSAKNAGLGLMENQNYSQRVMDTQGWYLPLSLGSLAWEYN